MTAPSSQFAPSSKDEQRICEHHGEYQARLFRISEAGPWMGGSCPKCAEEKERAEEKRKAAELERARLAKIERLVERAAIPKRFQTRTIENYQVNDPGEEKAKKIATWYLDTWNERLVNGTSLIFCGEPGTGKTHLACAIGNQLLEEGVSVLFTTVSEAMRKIKATYDKGSTMTEAQAIEIFTSPRLLILDEVHVQTGSDHEIRLMFEIINRRYENVLPTILISNLEATALKQFLGDRIVDRLREGRGQLMQFTWKSRRA